MSQYRELAARLRGDVFTDEIYFASEGAIRNFREAAAAIEAQQARIETLEAERDRAVEQLYAYANDVAGAISDREARCKRLEEALSDMVQRFELYAGPGDMHAGHHDMALLKSAREALEAKP